MKLKLTLTPEAREQDVLARIAAGLEVPDDFQGPEFVDAYSWSIQDNYVFVETETGEYWYNHSTVGRIRRTYD